MLRTKRTKKEVIKRFKVRILDAGNHQLYGKLYIETYALAVFFATVRTFIDISFHHNMKHAQLYIKIAVFNGSL